MSVTTTFAANGDWVCPAKVTQAVVVCIGPGGAGGTSDGSASGGGGGGGGVAYGLVTGLIPGSTYSAITGSAGAQTSFNSDGITTLVVAQPGSDGVAGQSSINGTGGAGGAGSQRPVGGGLATGAAGAAGAATMGGAGGAGAFVGTRSVAGAGANGADNSGMPGTAGTGLVVVSHYLSFPKARRTRTAIGIGGRRR